MTLARENQTSIEHGSTSDGNPWWALYKEFLNARASLQVPLQEGIRRTVEYFRNELEVARRSQNISDISVQPIRI